MWETHEEAITNYTTESITQIFISNLVANKKKYDELIEFYEESFYPFDDFYRSESYDHTRTPDLTSESSSSGTGSATTEKNQSRTMTTTPDDYTTTRTHSVDPFDESGMRDESQDVSVESGSSTTEESFSGDPDITATETESSSTVTTSGTEKNEYTKTIHGRSGKRPTSEVVADGLKAAAMHDILDLIIDDIANQVFLQVWI